MTVDGTSAPASTRRMRLTAVIASLGAGGAERVLSLLATAWAGRYDVTVLTWDAPGAAPFFPLSPRVRHQALDLDAVSRSPLEGLVRNVSRLRRLRAAIRATAPDLVVSFVDRVNVLTLLATRGLDVPVVVSERVDPRRYDPGPAWRWLRPLAYQAAAAVVVQTASTRDYLAARWRVPLVTIPNPVDPGTAGDAPGERLVVGLGRLVPQKGFDVLLRGFARAAIAEAGWRVEIAGSGPGLPDLMTLARDLGIDTAVAFPGTVKDSTAFLRRAGIFALTSRFEGFPNALAEAMALGRAVVATDCPTGPRELTLGGTAGRLVPVDDVDAVATALRELAASPLLRRQLGLAARAAMAPYAAAEVVKAWTTLFDSVSRRAA